MAAAAPRRAAGRGQPALRFDPEIAAFLEEIQSECGRPERLRRDPLALVKDYADPADRELAALVASTLAFGAVDLILRAVREALSPLGPAPARVLDRMSEAEIAEAWADFRYRYCAPKDLVALMTAARRARADLGSLEALFFRGDPGGGDIVAATGAFVSALHALGPGLRPNLLPDPARGSACKRLFLMLRWLVRRDSVDPGGWERVDPARLVIPLDTHMVRVCHERLGFLPRPAADLKAALRATAGFRLYAPDDPVKYDFALTRPGIDPEEGDDRFACP